MGSNRFRRKAVYLGSDRLHLREPRIARGEQRSQRRSG
jgi:hypothetical protein